MLYDELGITNLGELEYACKENRLVNLCSFGEKTQDRILQGHRVLQAPQGGVPLRGGLSRLPLSLKERLGQVAPDPARRDVREHQKAQERGREGHRHPRRRARTGPAISAHFTSMPEVEEVLAEGETKTSCRLASGINADLRVVDGDVVSAAPSSILRGARSITSRLRGLAQKRGPQAQRVRPVRRRAADRLASEADVYAFLGLAYVPPELREDMGEIEAAGKRQAPQARRAGRHQRAPSTSIRT